MYFFSSCNICTINQASDGKKHEKKADYIQKNILI